MLNHIIIMGRLTRDPDLRYTQSEIPVVNISVACQRDYAANGEEKETDFIDCVAWQSKAEFISEYFKKGDMIVCEGRLQFREWIDKDENKRKSAEILLSNVYFGQTKINNDEKTETKKSTSKTSYSRNNSKRK